jgi:serine/threonine protein kinase
MDRLKIVLLFHKENNRPIQLENQELAMLLSLDVENEDILTEIAALSPHIMLMTIKAFEQKGVDFCLKIKEQPVFKDIPFLLTGSAEESQSITGSKLLGIDGYVAYGDDSANFLTSLNDIYANAVQRSNRQTSTTTRKISLRGELAAMSLAELLSPIEQTHKTGCLSLHSTSGLQGNIYWQNGEIIAAKAGPYHGSLAFYLILDWEKGNFRFEEDIELPPREINLNSISLLMTGFQKLDEYRWLKAKLGTSNDLLFFKIAFMEGHLGKEMMEKALAWWQEKGAGTLQQFVRQEFSARYNSEESISLQKALEQVAQLANMAGDTWPDELSGGKAKTIASSKNISRHEDAILQRLLLSFSLVSLEQLNNCLQQQIEQRVQGKELSLYNLLLEGQALDVATMDRLLKLQNEDGKNLFPGYEVQEKIGEGGLGVVYRALQLSLKRDVALKVFAPELGDSTSVMRFMREADIATKLDHPNIVKAIDFGNAYGLYYFIMELIKGEPLDTYIAAHGPFVEKEAVTILLKLASALCYMWQQNMLYRDLKPSNIMLVGQGIKICDLGLARRVGAQKEIGNLDTLTNTGILLGTPAYMAPELFADPKSVDFRADVYSLGMTMYVILTGDLPFQNKEITVLQEYTSAKITPPRKKNSSISASLNDLTMRFLAKKPEERCQKPEDVIEALENIKYELIKKGKKTASLPTVSSKDKEILSQEKQPVAQEPCKVDMKTPAKAPAPRSSDKMKTPAKAPAPLSSDKMKAPAPLPSGNQARKTMHGKRWLILTLLLLTLGGAGVMWRETLWRSRTQEPPKTVSTESLQNLRKLLFSEKDPEIRANTLISMVNTRERSVIDDLLTALKDSSPLVRKAAVRGLGIMSAFAEYQQLITMLQDTDPRVRRETADSLRLLQQQMPKNSSKYKAIDDALKTATLEQP